MKNLPNMKNNFEIKMQKAEDFSRPDFTQGLIRFVIVIFLIILNFCYLNAQIKYRMPFIPAAGIELTASGNGHGGFYLPYAGFQVGLNALRVGPLVQMCTREMKGGRIAYSFNLTGNKHHRTLNSFSYTRAELLQFNFFSYFQYSHGQKLCQSVIAMEQKIARDKSGKWDNVRYNTSEGGAGFEVAFNFSNQITWRNTVAAAFFYHHNYVRGMDHENAGPALLLSTALQFNLNY